MQKELKPCPFCGGNAKAEKETYGIWWRVKCQNCPCEVGRNWFGTKAKVVEAWNRRV